MDWLVMGSQICKRRMIASCPFGRGVGFSCVVLESSKRGVRSSTLLSIESLIASRSAACRRMYPRLFIIFAREGMIYAGIEVRSSRKLEYNLILEKRLFFLLIVPYYAG